jgi:acyl transferase domain-containing protein
MPEVLYGPQSRKDERALKPFVRLANPVFIYLEIRSGLALSKLWASWGITPAAVVGHSLGEYVALNIVGVLSDVDTIYLVGVRAKLLQEKCTGCTHSMLVIKESLTEIAKVLAA